MEGTYRFEVGFLEADVEEPEVLIKLDFRRHDGRDLCWMLKATARSTLRRYEESLKTYLAVSPEGCGKKNMKYKVLTLTRDIETPYERQEQRKSYEGCSKQF